MILRLADTRIGENTFSLFMTSGNWQNAQCLARRRSAVPHAETRRSHKNEAKAQRRTALLKAIDYFLFFVVISFIAGDSHGVCNPMVWYFPSGWRRWIAGTAFCFGYQAGKKEVRDERINSVAAIDGGSRK